jgi:hypothetical protein
LKYPTIKSNAATAYSLKPKMPSCPICLESDSLGETAVSCPGCSEEICYQCFEQYCLSKDEQIGCFSTTCKFPWSEEFVDENSSNSFRNGRLRAHRSKILVDQEKARLPALQDRARILKAALKVKRKRTPSYIREVIQSNGLPLSGWTLSRLDKDELADILKIFGEEFLTTSSQAGSAATPPPKAKIQARPCYKRSCRGFLNSENNCGVCDTRFCKSCHEDITDAAASVAAAASEPAPSDDSCAAPATPAKHVCDPDVVATVRLIAEETKPCPTCQTAIFKIDGCDQMWCTQCQTPFSWRTGLKETGGVHNPHYYEWLRRTRGAVPRMEELRCEQGELMNMSSILEIYHSVRYWDSYEQSRWKEYANDINYDALSTSEIAGVNNGQNNTVEDKITAIGVIGCAALNIVVQTHRKVQEVNQYYLRPTAQGQVEEETELNKLGIHYLSGKITKSEWERRVYLQKRTIKRIQAQKDIMRVFASAATDILNAFITRNGEVKIGSTIKQLTELSNFTQEALDNCAERFFYTGDQMRSIEISKFYRDRADLIINNLIS